MPDSDSKARPPHCGACGAALELDAACARCGAAATLRTPDGSPYPAAGSVVQGRYELGPRAGASLLGPWYLAHDRVEKREVLLRGIPGALLREELTLTRLVADTRQALSLGDKGIIHPLRVVLSEPWAWLVEDPPTGLPLAERLGQGLSVPVATQILDRLLEILRYSHLHRAVHGALTLNDVHLQDDGSLCLRGYGQGALLARVISVDNPPLQPLAPPEVYRGDTPTAASDVYNAAALAYALLTGEPPFVGGIVHTRIKHEAPRDVHAKRPECPTPLSGAIRRALLKAAAERFPTAGDMIVAVRLAAKRAEAAGKAPERR